MRCSFKKASSRNLEKTIDKILRVSFKLSCIINIDSAFVRVVVRRAYDCLSYYVLMMV